MKGNKFFLLILSKNLGILFLGKVRSFKVFLDNFVYNNYKDYM